MLIYNSKKEFLGIEEHDLKALGFSNLSELIAYTDDFADMFVKTPGYINNFTHVSWIDFVACSDSSEIHKAIINVKSRNFKCSIDVKNIYLTDEPSSKAFLVYLNNIIELVGDEDENLSDELSDKLREEEPTESFTESEESVGFDEPINLDFEDEFEKEKPSDKEALEDEDMFKKEEVEHIKEEIYDNGYIYDPRIASDELGLPVELVEEFIGDFVAQANEFKHEMYESLNNGEYANVKTLSHKLKGVAANLRIEDALETLSVINTSKEINEIRTNLDTFYKIISKLSGEKILVDKTANETKTKETASEETLPKDDEMKLEFKIDDDFKDSEVPKKIHMPELADDDFLNQDNKEKIEIDNFMNIETMSDEEARSLQNESIELEDIELLDEHNMQDNNNFLDIGFDTLHTPYNKEKAAKEIGIPYENFLLLFSDYISEAKELTDMISASIDSNEPLSWQNKALQLQSMSNNMRIFELSQELDTLIVTSDSATAKKANNAIIKYIEEISNAQG